jgi:hypothetical protein
MYPLSLRDHPFFGHGGILREPDIPVKASVYVLNC